MSFLNGFSIAQMVAITWKAILCFERRHAYCAAHMGLSGPIGYQQLPLKWKILFVSKNCLNLKENLCSPPIIHISWGLYCWEFYTIYMQKMTMTPVCYRTPRVFSLCWGCISWHHWHQNISAVGGTDFLLFLDSRCLSSNCYCQWWLEMPLPSWFKKEKKITFLSSAGD